MTTEQQRRNYLTRCLERDETRYTAMLEKRNIVYDVMRFETIWFMIFCTDSEAAQLSALGMDLSLDEDTIGLVKHS